MVPLPSVVNWPTAEPTKYPHTPVRVALEQVADAEPTATRVANIRTTKHFLKLISLVPLSGWVMKVASPQDVGVSPLPSAVSCRAKRTAWLTAARKSILSPP